MKTTRKKWIWIAPVLGFLALLVGTQFFFENGLSDLPEIASHLYARENCMCVFVMNQDPQTCEALTSQMIPASDIRVDQVKKQVSVRVFWKRSQFSFKNERLGCVKTSS